MFKLCCLFHGFAKRSVFQQYQQEDHYQDIHNTTVPEAYKTQRAHYRLFSLSTAGNEIMPSKLRKFQSQS